MGSADGLRITAKTYRLSHDDTEHAKLMKDVLRSGISVQDDETDKKELSQLTLSFVQGAPRTRRRGRTSHNSGTALSMREVARFQERDTLCAGMAGVEDLSPLLRSCGRRISALTASMQAEERKLKAVTQRHLDMKASGNLDAFHNNIRVIEKADEDPRAMRTRNDQVVYNFVAAHAHFDKLEELEQALKASHGYDALRAIIPHKQNHTDEVSLDSELFCDKRKLQRTMWTTAPSQTTTPSPTAASQRTAASQSTAASQTLATDHFSRVAPQDCDLPAQGGAVCRWAAPTSSDSKPFWARGTLSLINRR